MKSGKITFFLCAIFVNTSNYVSPSYWRYVNVLATTAASIAAAADDDDDDPYDDNDDTDEFVNDDAAADNDACGGCQQHRHRPV